MLPLVILGGALYYLSRPNRNPDWITVGGKHRPLRAGDGRSGDPTPYDPARVGETGTARATRTAASPGFEAPESEAELRGEAKRLYARYKQVHAEYDTLAKAYDDVASDDSGYWSETSRLDEAQKDATTKALNAQKKASDAIYDATSRLDYSVLFGNKLTIRKGDARSPAIYYGGIAYGLMSEDDTRELVPDLQALQSGITRALSGSDSDLAQSIGRIRDAVAQGAAVRTVLEQARDRLPNAIKLAKLAVTAATKVYEIKAQNEALTRKHQSRQQSATDLYKKREAALDLVRELQDRLATLTGHKVYDGVIHFESRSTRASRLDTERRLREEHQKAREQQERLEQERRAAAAVHARMQELTREETARSVADAIAAQKAKEQAAALAREARLARATAKDLDRLKAQANDIAAKYNALIALADQADAEATRSWGGRGNYAYNSAVQRAGAARAKASGYEVRYRELERAIAAIERRGA